MLKSLMIVLLCGLWVLAGEVPEPTRAQWISYPEQAEQNRRNERYYRRAFTVNGEVKTARLYVSIDDKGSVHINGKHVPDADIPCVQKPKCYAVADMLVQGGNAIAVNMTNENGIGGVIARLEIAYADGRIDNIFTDVAWKCSRLAANGWQTASFNDAGWVPPMTYGDAFVQPWKALFDTSDLLSQAEKDNVKAVIAGRDARCYAMLEALKQEKKPVVGIAYPNGRAHFVIGGKAVPAMLYMTAQCAAFDSPKYREQIKSFAKGGTHLHGFSFHAHDVWQKGDVIDFQRIEHDLLEYLLLDPDGYFTVAISFERTPSWWIAAHPEECIQYETGKAEGREGQFGRFLAPSYASAKWIAAVNSVYARVVDFLEASPLSARIFSYRVDTGVYTEWHYFGLSSAMPDCSAPMTAAFRKWLRRHYATDEALQSAWHRTDVTRDTAVTPPVSERTKYSAGLMRDPVVDRWTLDYLQCHGEVCRDLVFEFAGTVKKHCSNRALVGQYSGYYFGMSFPAEGWHLKNDDVLNSPYIDFQITPSIYGEVFRGIGESGHVRSLIDSYRLKNKICIIEADTRTCLEPNNGHTYAKTDEESVRLLARDMAAAFAHGCGIWYYDFGKVWYVLPKLKEYLEKTLPEFRSLDNDISSAAEVVFIGDYDSVPYYANEQRPCVINYMTNSPIAKEMGVSGIAYDMISFADLANPGLKDYKVYIFMNSMYLDSPKRAMVDRLKAGGHTLVWLYAPGFLNENGHSVDNISAVTGIQVRETGGMAKPELKMDGKLLKSWFSGKYYYVFGIDDSDAVVYGTHDTEKGDIPALASKKQDGWTSVLCTCPFLPRQAIRKICDDAGIHRYCDRDDAVIFANKSMVMLHTREAGDYQLAFTRPVKWTMVFPEHRDIQGVTQTHTVKAGVGETYFFICK